MGHKPEQTVWIVCGGRVGRNLTKTRVWAVLDEMAYFYQDKTIVIVHGNAVWVDKWSGEWARVRGHVEKKYAIDDELDGGTHRAPFNRNQRMLDDNLSADMCLGFPGGGGTFDMMDRCHKAGVPVADIEIEYNGDYETKWWPQQ